MQEIKFKALVKHLKWVAPVIRINFDVKTVEVDLSDGQGDAFEYDFDEVEIMQYTGIKGKDGTEIYENNKEIKRLLDVATEEINHSFNPHKDEITKKVYLNNAKRFIDMAKEKLNRSNKNVHRSKGEQHERNLQKRCRDRNTHRRNYILLIP